MGLQRLKEKQRTGGVDPEISIQLLWIEGLKGLFGTLSSDHQNPSGIDHQIKRGFRRKRSHHVLEILRRLKIKARMAFS
jgi:hypothetical protein